MTICIRCGCTDVAACVVDGVPCSWALISTQTLAHKGTSHPPEALGVCSACDNGEEVRGFEPAGEIGEGLLDDDDDGPRIITPGDPRWQL